MWESDNIMTLSMLAVFAFVSLRLFAAHRETSIKLAGRINARPAESESRRKENADTSELAGPNKAAGDVTMV
ncbi:MAG: hypothetical protein IPK83_15030 [Planctomycetes bacterium]|nr:hypothetical protein [Planctomycetota bacterium]